MIYDEMFEFGKEERKEMKDRHFIRVKDRKSSRGRLARYTSQGSEPVIV